MPKIKKPYYKILIIILAVPVLLASLWWWGPGAIVYFQTHVTPYSREWYAVYLDNGQVLYGQVHGVNKSTLKLINIYYLQTVKVGDQTTSNLIRRGNQEISAPLNYLMINRAHVLYWEAVGADSQVMRVINNGQ